MSSYCNPQKNFIFNDEQIFLKKNKKMPNDKRMYLSASSTVEASLIMPVFIYAIMTFVYLIQIVGLQIKVQQGLYNECRKMARYAYAYEKITANTETVSTGTTSKGSTTSTVSTQKGTSIANISEEDEEYNSIIKNGLGIGVAQAMLITELGTKYLEKSHILGGVAGINMIKSKFMSTDSGIDIVATYSVKNPFDIFGIGIMTFTQRATVYAWVGDSYSSYQVDESKTENPEEVMVYITPSGTVYHRSRYCSYLVLSVHAVSATQVADERNESGGKYYACEKCVGEVVASELYITDYGERFHSDKNCSSIMRNIMTVKLSSVADRRECSKCSGGKE